MRCRVSGSWFSVLRTSLLTLCISILAFGQTLILPSGAQPTQKQISSRRSEWFAKGRTSRGPSPAELRRRAHQERMRLRAQSALRPHAVGRLSSIPGTAWTPLGPAPLVSDASGSGIQDYNYVSGRATAIAIDPNDLSGNTVYLGGAFGGLWKSTNAGSLSPNASQVSWTPVLDDQPTLAVGAIAIQQQTGNPDLAKSLLLVGTGETDSSSDSYYGLGILRSTDAGRTWNLVRSANSGTRSFAGLGFSKIAFSTANPNLAVAAAGPTARGITEGYEDPIDLNRGLYVSTDSGVNWNYATVRDAGVTIAPNSASSVAHNAVAGKFYAAIRNHGFYSSIDGVTWTRLANQPGSGLTAQACPPNPASSFCPIYRGELAVVSGRNEMYAWYVDANDLDQGIYRSLDAGSTWTAIDESGLTACGDGSGCGTEQASYNLALAAVPDGTTTDLFAGAMNIYKCRALVSNQVSCADSGWLNLTHVYGCTDIAKVHPAQHAIAINNPSGTGKELAFFANDGGIYRALDGFTGLLTGTCGSRNQFDSLNQTLGSITQFASLSMHPTDYRTMLGGSQGNGSPATASAVSSAAWINVMAGDGASTAMDPSTPGNWFASNPDPGWGLLSIKRCANGISCHTQDFDEVANSVDLGGDDGGFIFPYILDPQSATAMLVGTCRVWRGPRLGGSFAQVSNNFDTGVGPCTGSEVNVIRSLATGGPTDSNGSKVIYAVTDGPGPLQTAPIAGGRVFVTTNATLGPAGWDDRTQNINPDQYVISAVALDTSDATGNTAFVTIMGFGVSHVWKTINAGASWIDFTSNLPDAPANAIVIDSAVSTVYVGTDEGVYSSSTTTPSWTEIGPAPGSGISGFLPNVPVTALAIFSKPPVNPRMKKLRAATYGRGIWEFDLLVMPDYDINVSNSPLTVGIGKAPTITGNLTSTAGYASSVALTCTTGITAPPPGCAVSPAHVTPTPGGAAISVSASPLNSVADFTFNIHGLGSDVDALEHDAPVTLHVADFSLTAPTPSSTTANRPNSSAPVSFTVTASGSVPLDVTLSCASLPAGAACSFLPQGATQPTTLISVGPSSPVSVQLTILTSTTTPSGSYSVNITAAALGLSRQQILAFTVTAIPDFNLTLDSSSLTLLAGQSGQLTGTIQSINGYQSTVNLACASGVTAPPSTCTVSPAAVTPSSSGSPLRVTIGANTGGNYSFNVKASGTDASKLTHSAAASLIASGFQIGGNPGSPTTVTVHAGELATFLLQFAPSGTSTFPDAVTLACSGVPAHSTSAFTPTQIGAGSGKTQVTLTIATAAAHARRRTASLFYASWLTLFAMALFVPAMDACRSGRLARAFSIAAITLCVAVMVSCGGGLSGGDSGGETSPGTGTPPGSYTLTVTASSGGLSQSSTLTLIVN